MPTIKRLRWEADPTAGMIERVKLDPYSHWMIAYGRDFDFNALESIEHEDDFSFLAFVDEFQLETKVKDLSLLADIDDFQITAEMPRHDLIERLAEKIKHFADVQPRTPGPHHVFRLPLRKRSIVELPPPDENGRRPSLIFDAPDFGASSPPEIDGDRMLVTAVIDDHVNVVHDRFKADGKTRIDFAWFQDGVRSSGVPFGCEVTREQIDRPRTDEDQSPERAQTDEARLKELGLIDFTRPVHNPLALRASHGTHVLDLAAGGPPGMEHAADWRIITVSLPSLVTFETSGAFLGFFFLMGLQYILQRTRELSVEVGKPASLIVNCSYGIAGGPHDGTHLIERAIEGLLTEYHQKSDDFGDGGGNVTVDIVLPAGNGNLDRGHARVLADETAPDATPEIAGSDPRKAVTLDLPWRLQPGDLTSSYLEIWLPKDSRNVVLRMTVPGGFRQEIDLSEGPKLLCEGIEDDLPMNPVARVHKGVGWGGKQRIVVATGPTFVVDGGRRAAPAGLWRIEVSADLKPGQRIDAWVQRDASPIGSRVQGRQAYFDDPAYKRFDSQGRVLAVDPDDTESVVRREGTINGVATGTSPVVVAGHAGRKTERAPAPYSGTGMEAGRRPDCAAQSDHSAVLPGVMAAGTNSGSRVAINGTSAAAPLAARRLAEIGPHVVGVSRTERVSGLLDPGDDTEGPSTVDPDSPLAMRVGAGWLRRPLAQR